MQKAEGQGMDLGSRLRSEEADPSAGFAVLRNLCGGWRGRRVQDSSRTALLALLLLGRALLFVRPKQRAPQLHGSSAHGSVGRWARDLGCQEKGTAASKVPTFSLWRDVLACNEASA